jgi:methyl-accepting chemotaxis protein
MQESPSDYGKRLFDTFNIDFIKDTGEMLGGLIYYSTELNKSFLQNRQRIDEMQYAIADAIPGVQRLGGDISKVTQTISEVAGATRRNVIANTESVEKLFAASEVVGKSVDTLVNTFADIGIRFDQIDENLEESISYVQSIGGNAKDVMQDVLDNTEKLNNFNFANGVQGLTKMAAQASMLRFDMNQTFQLAEAALDPEKAVELSSAFQRLGVMSGTLSDPFQLMNQSINDPEGLQNSIVEMSKQFTYFDEKTKSFKINPQGMLTLREIQKQTGLSASELSKMGLAAAELDARLSQISPRITFANEEDKQYLANISTLNTEGEYTVKIKNDQGEYDIKKLSDVTQEEMNKLIEEQKKPQQTLEEIQRNQLTATVNLENDVKAIRNSITSGLASAPTLVKGMETAGQVITSVSGTASKRGSGVAEVPKIREYSETFISSVTSLVKDVASGNKNLGDALKEFGEKQGDLFGKMEGDFYKGAEKYFISVKEDLKTKGVNIEPLIEEFKVFDKNLTDKVGEFINTSTNQNKSTNQDKNEGSIKIYQDNNKRISETIDKNNQVFSDAMKESNEKMKGFTNEFMSIVDKVKTGEKPSQEISDWLSQNSEKLKEFGGSFYTTLETFSKNFQKDSDLKTQTTGFDTDIKNLESNMSKQMMEYKAGFDNIAQQVLKKEQNLTKLTDYISENKEKFDNLGGDFSKNMQNYAKIVTDKITEDQKTLDEINKLREDINKNKKTEKDLEDFFKKNSESVERLGLKLEKGQIQNTKSEEKLPDVKIEGKSSFIEGKNRDIDPIQSGKMQGGQSLTQVIQHKVEFGKITVDIQLPSNFSQLSTQQQQMILDQVFSDNKFKGLVEKVKELGGNQLSQDNNFR